MKAAKAIYLIVIISVTIFVVGFFGARRLRAFQGLFSDADIVKESVELEPFKKIDLKADVVNFDIAEGENYRIDYEYPDYMTLKGDVDNDTLKIELKGKKNSSFGFFRIDPNGNGIKTVEPKIRVTVPKGTELDKVDLIVSAGNINLSDRVIDEIKADCDAGNLNLSKITANKTEIQADAGNIEIKDSVLGDSEYCTSAGRIAIDDTVMNSVSAETNMGEIDFDNTTFGKGEVNSNMGSISIDGTFDELKSHADMGKISVDNENKDNAKYDLSLDMGQITVNGDSKGMLYNVD